jgi:DNA-binding GntR family transcriptional regulator
MRNSAIPHDKANGGPAAGRSESLRDGVFRALRRQISFGELVPGDRLTEILVAAALAVSRTPVREGLAALAREGLLVRDGRSYVVPSLDQDDINEVLELRSLLEPYAVQRAAEMARPAEVAELAQALREQKAAHAAAAAERFIAANIRFRDSLVGMVRNRRLRRAIALYNDYLSCLRTSFREPHWRAVIIRNFELFVRAVRAGDGHAAAKIWRKHLSEGADATARAWLRRRNGHHLPDPPPKVPTRRNPPARKTGTPPARRASPAHARTTIS